jgi:integrase
MPNPYLQRRGDTYNFRIAVPADLRATIKTRELVRTLRTLDRRTAIPRALYLASKALTLFASLRAMSDDKRKALELDYSVKFNLDELGMVISVEAHGEPNEQDAINSTIKTGLEFASRSTQTAPPAAPQSLAAASVGVANLTLNDIIRSYLADYPVKKASMLSKHRIVLPMFLEIVGDKPISTIKQADVKGFFTLLNKLPPYAKGQCQKLKMTYAELAQLSHPEVLSPSSFEDTYKACVRQFLSESKRDWLDDGFPAHLTTDGCDYAGKRKKGQNKQRAMTIEELRRLFEGPELQSFSTNPQELHKFWLPVLALYTGARVNELCQVNPQTDVRKDPTTDIWHLRLTEDSPGGDRIVKKIKTGENRAVPIHRHLIDLGFIEYVVAVKKGKSKQLFPAWKSRNSRAAPNAIEWFGKFLTEIGLSGIENENGRSLRGTHAFRHTLLTYGKKAGLNLRCISGHSEPSENPVADGYEEDVLVLNLAEKRDRLDKLDYGLTFPTPARPTS